MKKTMMVLTGVLVLAFFANCGKNDDGPKGGAVEMSAGCFQSSRMNTSNAWGQQVQQPYTGGLCSYPYTTAINSGLTNVNSMGAFGYTAGTIYGAQGASCTGTQSQAYSPTKGLACVDNTRITQSGQPVVYDINPATGNFTPISTPIPNFAYQTQYGSQYGYQQSYYGNQYPLGSTMGLNQSYLPSQNSATQVLRVCDGSEPCPGNQFCRPALGPAVGAGTLGICYF